MVDLSLDRRDDLIRIGRDAGEHSHDDVRRVLASRRAADWIRAPRPREQEQHDGRAEDGQSAPLSFRQSPTPHASPAPSARIEPRATSVAVRGTGSQWSLLVISNHPKGPQDG
jgi:hypothetical protein